MATHYRNTHEIQVELVHILHEIVVGFMDGLYDEHYNMHTWLLTFLNSIDQDTISKLVELFQESEPVDSTVVLEDVTHDAEFTNDTNDQVGRSAILSSGDAPSLELGPVEPTPITEDGPLDDTVKKTCEAENEIEPAQGIEEPDSGEVVGRLDPPATTGKSDQPRRYKTSCWKGVRRIFRRLCCWRRETVRDPR